MGTGMSYIVLATAAVAVAFYYNPAAFHKLRDFVLPVTAPAQEEPSTVQVVKKPRQKRTKQEIATATGTSTPLSLNDTHAAKKRKITEPVSKDVKAQTTNGKNAVLPRVDDTDAMNNAEFAKQLKQAQEGTKMQPLAQQTNLKKNKRSAKAPAGNNQLDSAETSSNGRDADDDMSPSETPPSSVSRGGDVSDMLEASGPQVSTIRLTNTEAAKPKKAAPKPFEAAQTKKQRQRQKQNDENRRLQEEADRIQNAKKQNQIHTARTAEGTSKQMKASTFAQNAWQNKSSSEQKPQEAQPAQQSLLDTFDGPMENNKPSVSTLPAEALSKQSENNVSAMKETLGEEKTQALAASERERPNLSRGESWADEVNAEEQDQWAQELTQKNSKPVEWQSVTTKKGRKRNKKDNETSSEASHSLADLTNKPAPKVKPAMNGTQKTTNPPSTNRYAGIATKNDDNTEGWEA